MGWYDAFRDKPASTQYDEIHSPATVDVFEAGLIFAFSAIGFSFFILLPGYMGKERYSVALRIFLSLFIGAGILCLPVEQKFNDNKTTEYVDYNEKFLWNSPWSQGRPGFGPHASQVNNEYHDAMKKGIPYPILLVAEYFTIDGENIRWGRCFRLAGFYTQMSLWLAFSLWVITNILFLMVIRYGAYFLAVTGVVILLGNLMYDKLHYGPALVIPFAGGNLSFAYGWCFWMSLAIGFLCLVLGVLIVVLDYFYPAAVATFFNVDIVTEFEDIVMEEHEIVLPGVSTDSSENDLPTARDTDTAEDGEPSEKRIHFVSRSRYAGISNWNPGKSPLAQSQSFPTTCKERISLGGESDVPEGIPRSSSVRINIEHSYDNEAIAQEDRNAQTANGE